MKELCRRLVAVVTDLRVVVAVCGAMLSIVMHELFHIITHWGDIRSIGLFPDGHTIAEVVFAPSRDYDLVFEEAVAYGITMIVLMMTARLVYEIHDARDTTSLRQTILNEYFDDYTDKETSQAIEHLSVMLGVGSTTSSRYR